MTESLINSTAFDPRVPEVMDDPFPLYREITDARKPVFSRAANCWLYGSHSLCSDALADAVTYSVAKGVQFEDEDKLPSGIPLLIVTDPPEHTRLRRFMAHAFRPDSIAQFAEEFGGNMSALINAFTSVNLDLITDLALPWAIENSLSLLEIPADDRVRFREWMTVYLHRDRGDIGFTEAGNAALEQAVIYLLMVHLPRLRQGGDSFMCRLLQSEVDGTRMSDEEAAGLLLTMAVVGAEDTTRTFANVVYHLDDSANLPAGSISDAESIYALIDETIRFAPSTQYVRRTTTRAVSVAGVDVPAGAKVLILFGAANRDPDVFTQPDLFDPSRANSQRALGFSRGAHSCLGIHVARLQLKVGLEIFLDRSQRREIRYGSGEWVHAMNISGYQSLPAKLWWK